MTRSSRSSSQPSRLRVLLTEAGGAPMQGVGPEQPLEVDLDRAAAGLPVPVDELDAGKLHHLDDLLGEDAVGARRRVHAVEGEQAAIGAPVGPRPEEPGVRHRVQRAQRAGQLVGGPPGRPRPGTVDVAAGREPIEDRPHVEQVPVEAIAAGGGDGADHRLVVGVDGGVDRPGLVAGDERIALGVEVLVGDPRPGVVGEVPGLRPDLVEGAAGDRRDGDGRDRRDDDVLGCDLAQPRLEQGPVGGERAGAPQVAADAGRQTLVGREVVVPLGCPRGLQRDHRAECVVGAQDDHQRLHALGGSAHVGHSVQDRAAAVALAGSLQDRPGGSVLVMLHQLRQRSVCGRKGQAGGHHGRGEELGVEEVPPVDRHVVERCPAGRSPRTLAAFPVVLDPIHVGPQPQSRRHDLPEVQMGTEPLLERSRQPLHVQRQPARPGRPLVRRERELLGRQAQLVRRDRGPGQVRAMHGCAHEPVGQGVPDGDETVLGRGSRAARYLDPERGVGHRLPWARADLDLVGSGPSVRHGSITLLQGQASSRLERYA